MNILGEVFKISKGKKAIESSVETSLRYIQIGDLRNDEVMKYTTESSTNVLCTKQDILIAWDGANAGTVGYNLEGVIGSTLAKLSPKIKGVHIGFVGRFLQSKFAYLRESCTGATIPHLSRPVLSNLQIPLPPLETQQKIASILDAADTLRQKDKALLAKYDELTQSLFLDMFGDIILNNKLFNIHKISDVCKELFLGLTSKVDYVETGGFPLVRATDINKGVLDLRNVKYISEVQHKKLTSRRITKRGDVLISKSGSLGTCAIVNTDIQFSTYESIFTVRVNQEYLNNTFLVYMIRNDSFQRKLLGNQVGGTVAHLNLNMFRDFEFPLPPLNLQTQFAERVQAIEVQKAKAQASLVKAEELFNSLLQRAFKGELV